VGLAVASFEQKRQLVELLIDCVVVTDDDVEIRYCIATTPTSEQVRFCHVRTDYFGRPQFDLCLEEGRRIPPSHMIWWLGVVLLQFGLFGLYGRHIEALGWLGLTGFVLVFFGASLTAGILLLQSSAVPLTPAGDEGDS